MKKLLGILTMAIVIGLVATGAYAATTLSQSATATVASILSVEYAEASYTSFTSAVPWTSVNATQDYIRPTGYDTTNVKSDTGLYCRYNGTSANWYLKMKLTTTGALAGKVYRLIGQPKLRDVAGTVTNGTVVGGTTSWVAIPATDTTVYTSGTNDTNNVPNGTFAGVNLCLRPAGLTTGTTYTGTIVYTITATP